MLIVCKYPVPIIDYPKVTMRANAQILKFGTVGRELYLWALIDPEEDSEKRIFRLAFTNDEIDHDYDDLDYTGTAFLEWQMCACHLFESRR